MKKKIKKYTLTIILILFCNLIFAQKIWFVNNPKGFDFYLTTTIEDGVITRITRKNALIDIVGRFKFTLAKMTSSIIYPEIVHFKGNIKENSFKGKYQKLFDQLNFTGVIKNDSLKIVITHENNHTTELKGVKVDKIKTVRDYKQTVNTIIKLTERNVDNQQNIKSYDWSKFKMKMLDISERIHDDYELEIAFGGIAKKLPEELIEIVKENTRIYLDLE